MSLFSLGKGLPASKNLTSSLILRVFIVCLTLHFTGTFNLGGPAPNVNPFGQTTPAKQTGAAFGQTGTDATPKSQTGSMFQFGQTNNNSTTKGFDFSSSATPAGGSGTAGFNFSKFIYLLKLFSLGV